MILQRISEQKKEAGDGVPGASGACLAPTGAETEPQVRFTSPSQPEFRYKNKRVMGIERAHLTKKLGRKALCTSSIQSVIKSVITPIFPVSWD